MTIAGMDRSEGRCLWTFRTLIALLSLVAVGLGVVATCGETARSTLLRRASYDAALAKAHAYDRLYTQVLPDPAAAGVTTDLLARLPIDPSLVTANLRVVLPPATLRGMVDAQLDRILAYAKGRSATLALRVDLQPVFSNIAALANRYVGRALADAPTYNAGTIRRYTAEALAAVADIGAGRLPGRLPRLSLTLPQSRQLAQAMLRALPAASRSSVADQLQVQLAEGDLAGALSLVGPYVFAGVGKASADLSSRLEHGDQLNLSVSLAPVRRSLVGQALSWTHSIGGMLVWLELGAVALMALLVFAAGRLARLTPIGLMRLGVGVVLATVVVTAMAWVVLRQLALNALRPLTGPSSGLPPSARRLVADIGSNYLNEVQARAVQLLAAAVLTCLTVVLLRRLAARLIVRRGARQRAWVTGTAAVLPLLVVLAGAVGLPRTAAAKTLVCNGSHALCARPYDDVTFAAAHNAMATSEDHFLGPAQDPSMVHQLDNGVRALLIDTHYWTPDAQASAFVQTLPSGLRAALAPYAKVATYQRAGTWLCHDICQLGATPLVSQLHQVSEWLARNPDEVVTFIVQDAITTTDTMRAVRDSGLMRYVATPPADPDGAWPTLGSMVSSGKRVFIFAEQSDVPGGWYRNFYRYASDTPFRNQTTRGLACQPNRGNVTAPLLLVNDWVTRAASSRREAATANAKSFIINQAKLCQARGRRQPNFVAVDFASIGDLQAAVDALNGV